MVRPLDFDAKQRLRVQEVEKQKKRRGAVTRQAKWRARHGRPTSKYDANRLGKSFTARIEHRYAVLQMLRVRVDALIDGKQLPFDTPHEKGKRRPNSKGAKAIIWHLEIMRLLSDQIAALEDAREEAVAAHKVGQKFPFHVDPSTRYLLNTEATNLVRALRVWGVPCEPSDATILHALACEATGGRFDRKLVRREVLRRMQELAPLERGDRDVWK